MASAVAAFFVSLSKGMLPLVRYSLDFKTPLTVEPIQICTVEIDTTCHELFSMNCNPDIRNPWANDLKYSWSSKSLTLLYQVHYIIFVLEN